MGKCTILFHIMQLKISYLTLLIIILNYSLYTNLEHISIRLFFCWKMLTGHGRAKIYRFILYYMVETILSHNFNIFFEIPIICKS